MTRAPLFVFGCLIGPLLVNGCAGGELSGAANPERSPHSTASVATMQDFWNGRAYFKLYAKFKTPSPDFVSRSISFNVDQSVTADRGGAWYLFHREVYNGGAAGSCPDAHRVRIVVRTSTDQGRTWTRHAQAVVPNVPQTPTECQAVDGDAFYDSQSGRWHMLYQCMGADRTWHICHCHRKATDPRGAWTQNKANPVVKNRSLFKLMGLGALYDEGTPDIIERSGGGFVVSFHGVSASNGAVDAGYRAVALARDDFTKWSPINDGPIFSAQHTLSWRTPWQYAVKGGGHATTLKDGGHYYALIEASDKQAFVRKDQNWAHGLMRSTALASRSWEGAAQNPVISSKRHGFMSYEQPNYEHASRGTVSYPRLFKDSAGRIHLMHGADQVSPMVGNDPVAGHYLYRLIRGAPLLDFRFIGGNTTRDPALIRTETVSRGRGDALARGVLFGGSSSQRYARFQRQDARIELENNPFLLSNHSFKLDLDLTVHSLPTGGDKSAFIAGQPGAFWLELYASGSICFWVNIKGHGPRAACQSSTGLVGQGVRLKALFDHSTGKLQLAVGGSVASETLGAPATVANDSHRLTMGSAGPNAQGFYASPDMTLRRLRFYDRLVPLARDEESSAGAAPRSCTASSGPEAGQVFPPGHSIRRACHDGRDDVRYTCIGASGRFEETSRYLGCVVKQQPGAGTRVCPGQSFTRASYSVPGGNGRVTWRCQGSVTGLGSFIRTKNEYCTATSGAEAGKSYPPGYQIARNQCAAGGGHRIYVCPATPGEGGKFVLLKTVGC